MGYIEDLRQIVGTRPLILVGACVGALDNQGRLLLQKRSNRMWGLPGGLLELGESAEEAARREVFEETGVEIGELELAGVFSGKQYFVELPNGDQFYPVTIAYKSKDIKNANIKIDGHETLDAGFFDIGNLPENTSPLVASIINKFG
ncbi:NUDIX hydrolase [Neobacillus citreus]|uniref:NUDIX domain-containing protein n=1 Tax=Neobacillus citreus TaxID=2833578 RepID=A0A942YA35_9BACI|nr:NUDIX domain-containing protein [Neobacillus citreus]MCH6267238.1 NUDIX domain-containing protein [Neobacillus citreus]